MAMAMLQLRDLDKARLFLRALNSYTTAEAALRHAEKLKAPFRSLVDRLLSNWERTETQARNVPAEEAVSILRDFMGSLDERMAQGQRDIQERFACGERVGSLFLAWGLFYLFKTKALDLVEELSAPEAEHAGVGAHQEEPLPASQGQPDRAALRDFQMALGLGP
ncbi:MAG: hypothetical protein Q8O86_00190 [Dehalococcoidia bacterium]|nr:hypothetical protein [Dehalococcoidia bacterium]